MTARRITVLCDNTVGPVSGTVGEHGFSVLVEGNESLLFDTGQGETLLKNAHRMNRDLRKIDRVVLSHGHWDHTGGLWHLLSSCGPKQILAHPSVFARRYRLHEGSAVSTGIPYSEEFLRGIGASFSFGEGWREAVAGVDVTGEVPRTSFETGDAGLFCDCSGCMPDSVPDDQSLVIRGDRGITVVLGCCHAGLVNTLSHIAAVTGAADFHAVVGGTHLAFSEREHVEETVRALRKFRIGRIYFSHCTGFQAAVRLAKEFPGKVQPAAVGFTLEV